MLKAVFVLLLTSSYLSSYCAFCDRAVLDRQKFYEDDFVLALYTHKPILPGHCLVISKRHVERFEQLADEEIIRIGQVIKMVHRAASRSFGTSSYLLLQKNGQEVGQMVPHVHFHYVPRQAGDSSSLLFVLKMYLANLKSPISSEEMQEQVEKLKSAIK